MNKFVYMKLTVTRQMIVQLTHQKSRCVGNRILRNAERR